MSSLRLSLAPLMKQAQDRTALKSALNSNDIPKQIARSIYVNRWFLMFWNSAALRPSFDKKGQ